MSLRRLALVAGLVLAAAAILWWAESRGTRGDQRSGVSETAAPAASDFASVDRSTASISLASKVATSARVQTAEEKNLFGAIEQRRWQVLLEYLKTGDANVTDAQGMSLLHWAVLYGEMDAVKALLAKGASLDAQDDEGRTPLMLAAAQNRVAAAELLMSEGAGLEIKNDVGQTAVLVAVENSQGEMLNALAKAGASLEQKFGEHEFNAYLLASVNGDARMMDSLVKLDPRLALAEDREGRTAAHWSCAEGNIEVAASVIRHGGRLNSRDRYKRTALDYAHEMGSEACVAFVEEGGLADHM